MPRIFNNTRFGQKLKKEMFETHTTFRKLESISGISNAFLNQIIKHNKKANIDIILWLCDWMGTPLEMFIDSTKEEILDELKKEKSSL